MDEIRQTIGRLRETVSQWLEPNETRPVDAGAVVREQVVRLLKRRDLRIAAEALLGDLRNAVTGYETFDHETQRHALEDAMRVIEKIEALIAGDRVLNPNRIELPDPPAFMGAQLKANLDKIRQEARSQKDRLQRESQTHRLARRPARLPSKPAETPAAADRASLSFSDALPPEHTRRGDRRPHPPQHRRPDQPPPQNAAKPKPPGGPTPPNQPPRGPGTGEGGGQDHRNRHRRHRRKKP